MSAETLTVADLNVEVRRSARRRTRELTVDRTGELVLHAPESVSTDELRCWVESKLLWIHRKLLIKEAHPGKVSLLDAVSGETVTYLGRNYRLKLVNKQGMSLRLHGEWFFLRKADRENAASLFQKWYEDSGAEWVKRRIAVWTSKVCAVPQDVAVCDLGFRWGSCAKSGILRFNWKLFQLPIRLIDYVIVHEMAHLIERNHTSEYWLILDRVLPDWRERKKDLSNKSADVHWNL